MSTAPKRRLTETEYLAIERAAETRSEFYQGEMFAMAGVSLQHSLIASNLNRAIGNAIDGRGCQVHQSELRVKVDQTGLYTYPDIVVFCGKAQLEDNHFDTLLNPTILIEVLSDSTEAYDRGAKFSQYRTVSSLKEYVLVSQKEASCERFVRQPNEDWAFRAIIGLESTLMLDSIQIQIPLALIYRDVEFPVRSRKSGVSEDTDAKPLR
jgi:Uma2 family endonuclease